MDTSSAGNKCTYRQNSKIYADENSLQLIFSIPGFVELIEQAATLWEPSCIIHGDSKLNNFLLKTANNDPAIVSFKIIDWELVNTGDPLWDLVFFFKVF